MTRCFSFTIIISSIITYYYYDYYRSWFTLQQVGASDVFRFTLAPQRVEAIIACHVVTTMSDQIEQKVVATVASRACFFGARSLSY